MLFRGLRKCKLPENPFNSSQPTFLQREYSCNHTLEKIRKIKTFTILALELLRNISDWWREFKTPFFNQSSVLTELVKYLFFPDNKSFSY